MQSFPRTRAEKTPDQKAFTGEYVHLLWFWAVVMYLSELRVNHLTVPAGSLPVVAEVCHPADAERKTFDGQVQGS